MYHVEHMLRKVSVCVCVCVCVYVHMHVVNIQACLMYLCYLGLPWSTPTPQIFHTLTVIEGVWRA